MSARKKKSKFWTLIWWVGIVLSLASVIGGGSVFVKYFYEANKAAEVYHNTAEIHDSVLNDPQYVYKPIIYDPNLEGHVPGITEKDHLPECEELYKQNSDLVGWISVPETIINYPVMQTEINNRDFYLRRDFNKRYSAYGCIYVAEECDVFKPSDIVTLYGHKMGNGSMFAELHKYVDYDYWYSHPYFTFDTLYEHHTYEIAIVFRIRADDSFRYHTYSDFIGPTGFNDYVAEANKRSYYDTGVELEYGDKLVVLSTCEYTLGSDSRLVVVGKRIS